MGLYWVEVKSPFTERVYKTPKSSDYSKVLKEYNLLHKKFPNWLHIYIKNDN